MEDMTDSAYNNNPRRLRQQHARAFARDLRARFSSPYTNPRIFKAKTTKTNSDQWNFKCQHRFFKAIRQLGGIDKASPEAVLALTNKDHLHHLDLEEIADQMHIHQEEFKKIVAQQENPNMSSNKNVTWTKDHIARFVGVVKRLGGVNKVSPQEILEAMKEDINDSFCLTIDEIRERLCRLRALLKGIEEGGGYGPVLRRRSVRSGPYGQGWVGPKNGSRVEFLWTLDWHKRFVDAVEKLGGVAKATSSAILEVMKEEEGLTRLIVWRHLEGLRRVTNGNGSNNYTGMADGDHQAKEANSGSFEDVLNNFSELNLTCQSALMEY